MTPEFLEQCIERALAGQSACTADALAMEGMSGDKTRHLYNNLLAYRKPDGSRLRYLEVGCWLGSSTVAALLGNDVCATVIDNWSEFGGPRDSFRQNMEHYFGVAPPHIQVIEDDCFATAVPLAHAPYDVYLYDGNHSAEAHESALTHFCGAMADTCLVIVDDWNCETVRRGTAAGLAALRAQGVRVEHRIDVYNPTAEHNRREFWNGVCLLLLRKPAPA